MTVLDPNWLIQTEEALRKIIPDPHPDLILKKIEAVEQHSHNFIAHSPFVAISTRQPDGKAATAARADYPGFVRVKDAKTLLLPEYEAK
jgi:predicted pyridoxine 5'-phosphate oxidase superfamily flavin-nucleotide-binding protein